VLSQNDIAVGSIAQKMERLKLRQTDPVAESRKRSVKGLWWLKKGTSVEAVLPLNGTV